MPKLNPAIIALAAVALTAPNIYAANATAADAYGFHLWLRDAQPSPSLLRQTLERSGLSLLGPSGLAACNTA